MKELKDILKAKKVIANKINKTPLILAKSISKDIGINIYFKPEVFQKTRSFKIRGVFNKLHYLKDKKKGVITFSAGSHALSLAYAASLLGIRSMAIMPKNAPSDKVKAIKNYGTEVILADKNIQLMCEEIGRKEKLTVVHPFDDPLIIAGQGTIGLEILDELAKVNIVVVPIGGGGLISGIAAAIKLQKPEIKIIGVEPFGAPTMYSSISQNKIIHLKKRDTLAESLAAPYVGKHTLDYVKKYVDDLVLVSDQEIISALGLIWKKNKIKVEPSGAAALAAVIFKKFKIPTDSNVVCILSGGNIDNQRFRKILGKIKS